MAAILVTAVAPSPAIAQSELPPGAAKDALSKNRIDLSVPDSPAFTALGLTPEEVIRPTSPKELATGLLSGVDENGNLQTGVAIDSSPYLLFYGDQVTLGDYDDSFMTRFLARSQVSVATAKGTSDDDRAIRVGLGLRLTPFDLGDPRRDEKLMSCFRDKLRNARAQDLADHIEEIKIELLDTEEGSAHELELNREAKRLEIELDAETDAQADECRKESEARNWNRSSVSLGAAPTWIAKKGGFDDLGWNAGTFWGSAAYGFERVPGLENSAQALLSARYTLDESVPVPGSSSDTFEDRDALTLGFQLRLAVFREDFWSEKKADTGSEKSPPVFILGAEADYVYADREDAPNDNYYKVSVGADVKVPVVDFTYFKISVGGTGGRKDGANEGFVLGTFKYGF